LAQALVADETTHPDQHRLRRALMELDELWRRSGGAAPELAPVRLRDRIRGQLEGIASWDNFLHTRVALRPEELIDASMRERLEALPGSLHLRGDTVPLDYEIQNGEPVARVRLREGQAKRLRVDEIPRLDRPLRFAVQRGRHVPLQADTLPALQALLRQPQKPEEDVYKPRHPERGRGHRHPGGRSNRRRRPGDRGRPRR
jgi:hypothetical protein